MTEHGRSFLKSKESILDFDAQSKSKTESEIKISLGVFKNLTGINESRQIVQVVAFVVIGFCL